ncbi:MAG TPA: hypothetical protein VFA18_21450 [Gemmataceae bacterium]|nr:hypothetical protein [Gemmataceae bacterium]
MGNRVHHPGWLVLALVLIGGGLALALDPPGRSPKDKTGTATTAKPATAKVKKEPFKVELTLKGVFEAEQMHELAIHPKSTTGGPLPGGLVVVHAIPHGRSVKKGDILVQLDTEKLDRAIKDRKADRTLARLALKEAEAELPLLEQSLPLDLAAAERTKRYADEDYKKFVSVDRPLGVESAEQMVKYATYRLEAAREELKQLQSMYRDKDLTEETEEYILKRQRQEVKDAEFYLKIAMNQRDQTLQTTLPRREIGMKEDTVRQTLALDRVKNSSPVTLARKKISLKKQQDDLRRSSDDLRDLEQDREALTVRAPADGIVYYGKYSDGQWSPAAQMEAKLRPHGTLMPDEVFMTVVGVRPLSIRATVEEKDLHALRPAENGTAVPAGYPRLKLPAKLTSVSTVPQGPGKFEAQLAVDLGKRADAIMPGMAAEVKLTTYHKQDALTVPASAVFVEDDGESHYVYLAQGHKKHTVKVGESNGKRTEILDGLHAGEEILLNKPE